MAKHKKTERSKELDRRRRRKGKEEEAAAQGGAVAHASRQTGESNCALDTFN